MLASAGTVRRKYLDELTNESIEVSTENHESAHDNSISGWSKMVNLW